MPGTDKDTAVVVDKQVTDAAAQSEDVAGTAMLQKFMDSRSPDPAAASDSPAPAPEVTDGKSDDAVKGSTPAPADSATEKSAPDDLATEKSAPDDAGKFAPSPQQTEAAKHLGFTDDEISHMTPESAQVAEKASLAIRQQGSKLGRLEQQLLKQQAAGDADAAGKPAATDDGSQDGASRTSIADLQEASPDDSFEEIVEKMNAMRGALQDMGTKLSKSETQYQESVNNEVATDVDAFFGKLDGKIYGQFGAGPMSAVSNGTDQYKARQELLQEAKTIHQVHEDAGRDVPTAKCLEMALAIVAHAQYTEAIQQSVRDEFKPRDQGSVARPSSNASIPEAVDEDEKGRQIIREFARKQGRTMT